MPGNLNGLPWVELLKYNGYHPSPRDWPDQVFYFFLIDRFSDGNEDPPGGTPLYSATDNGNAIGTEADAAAWRATGAVWQGGTLQGARSKIGYLQQLGVTALWVSPVLRQRPGVNDYHGYGVQPNCGSRGSDCTR
jgi:glycosidase